MITKWSRCIGSMCIFVWASQPLCADGPTADELIEKSIKASGGKEAYAKLKSQVQTGTMEVTNAGIRGAVKIYQLAPNKTYMSVEIPNFGLVEEGFNGEVAWAKDAISGTRIKKGSERALAERSADFQNAANWKKYYKSAEAKGEETVNGKPCYKVELISNEGEPTIQFLDKETGHAVKVVATVTTQMGKITSESFPSDYKKVGDLVLPHKIVQKVLGQEIVITVDKTELNAEIAKDRFDLPDEVKKLVEKDKKDGSEKKDK